MYQLVRDSDSAIVGRFEQVPERIEIKEAKLRVDAPPADWAGFGYRLVQVPDPVPAPPALPDAKAAAILQLNAMAEERINDLLLQQGVRSWTVSRKVEEAADVLARGKATVEAMALADVRAAWPLLSAEVEAGNFPTIYVAAQGVRNKLGSVKSGVRGIELAKLRAIRQVQAATTPAEVEAVVSGVVWS